VSRHVERQHEQPVDDAEHGAATPVPSETITSTVSTNSGARRSERTA
jgi:hypothetical protein